jgi:hypothetical protein
VSLIETANPAMGVGYSVKDPSVRWACGAAKVSRMPRSNSKKPYARIPAELHGELARIATDDRAEQTGFHVAAVIERWSAMIDASLR